MEAEKYADGSKTIYFAAGTNTGEGLPNLSWVARNFPGHKICLLHILQPSRLTPYSRYARGIERKNVQENLNKYYLKLREIGLEGEEVFIKMEKIEEGIVKLISQHGIKNLAMGASAREMFYIESKVTRYVSDKGSESCQIWFLHKGHLIKTRYEQGGENSMKMVYIKSLTLEKPEKESAEAACKAPAAEILLAQKMQPVKDKEIVDIKMAPHVLDGTVDDELHEQLKQAMAEANNAKRDAFEALLRRRKAEKASADAAQRAEAAEKNYNHEMQTREESEDVMLRQRQKLGKMRSQLVPLTEELKSALGQNSSLECEIAESKKDIEELREKIVSSVQMLLSYRNERDELKVMRDGAFRVAEELRQEAESAAKSSSSLSLPHFLSEFSFSQIANATCYFHPCFKINELGSRSIYKGILHHTEVAINLLHGDSFKGPSEYRLEVEAMSRLRHRNIVTLIGVCPEAPAVIYEHLPNGSLEDRLSCKDNSSPLPWKTRISIAFELCSVLIFLHSSKPQCFVHGALNPSNILLDANFTCKISQFGTSRALATSDLTLQSYVNELGSVLKKMVMQRTTDEGSNQSQNMSRRVASCPYMDPEFVITGDATPQIDVYSFGKIILKLLTGKEAATSEVQRALDDGSLSTLLDSSGGDWPYRQAQHLAYTAVKCTDMNRENRPHLESELLQVLRTMKED